MKQKFTVSPAEPSYTEVTSPTERLKQIEHEISKLHGERMDIEHKAWQDKLTACKAAGHNDWHTERMHGSSDYYRCRICGAEDFR